MLSDQGERRQGPYQGSKCVAGHWGAATIRRVNEDGSFTIEPDDKPTLVMPHCYGVTLSEISFNDAERWPAVLGRLTGRTA